MILIVVTGDDNHGHRARSRLPPLSSGSGSSGVQKEKRPSRDCGKAEETADFGDYEVITNGNGNNRLFH